MPNEVGFSMQMSSGTKSDRGLLWKFQYKVIFFSVVSNHEFWSQNKFLKISGWNTLFLFENIFGVFFGAPWVAKISIAWLENCVRIHVEIRWNSVYKRFLRNFMRTFQALRTMVQVRKVIVWIGIGNKSTRHKMNRTNLSIPKANARTSFGFHGLFLFLLPSHFLNIAARHQILTK